MDTERLGSFLQSVERAETSGVVFDRSIIERTLVAVTEGRLPSSSEQSILEGFLVFVGGPEADGIFDIREKEHAAWFLDRLRKGNYKSPIPDLRVVTRALPPPATAIALAIPAGTQPAVDLLIRAPHGSLLEIYNRAVLKGIGSAEQKAAVEKALWLRPLAGKDYRLVTEFLERVQKAGLLKSEAQGGQARFLLELLGPGNDPHLMVERLRSSGLAETLHTTAKGPPIVVEVMPPGAGAAASLDDLLLQLSTLMQEAAEEGNTHRLEKLAMAARKVAGAVDAAKFGRVGLQKPKPPLLNSLFQPIRPFQKDQYSWRVFDEVATSPYINAALMPLGVVEHVLASAVIGEISWGESWDEAVDVLGGSALVGGTLLGTVLGWHGLLKFFGDQKVGQILQKVNSRVSPRVRAYLVPVLFLSAFTFMAMRQTQSLPLDEAWDYRQHMMQELLEGLGVNFVVTGGAFFTINYILARLGRAPAGKAGATGVLALAAGAGMLFQEFYMGWRRKQMRRELKEKSYADLVAIMEMLPTAPEFMRPRLLENIDRKFSILIALNVLEFPSVQQTIKQALNRDQMLQNYIGGGMSKEMSEKMIALWQKEESLTKSQQEIAASWIDKMSDKEGRAMLSVSVLPAQKRRILALWESDLADLHWFLARPIPLDIGKKEDGTIPSAQFAHWNIAHTMSLLRRYVALREKLDISGSRNVSVDTEKEEVEARFH